MSITDHPQFKAIMMDVYEKARRHGVDDERARVLGLIVRHRPVLGIDGMRIVQEVLDDLTKAVRADK